MNRSRYLNATQWTGLLRTGDVLIPGNDVFPSFSASGCAEAVDRMLPHMHDDDRQGVRLVLTLFRFLPSFAIAAILWLSDRHRVVPPPLDAALRMLNLGVKGVVMTLYYSDVGRGPSIHQQMGWNPQVVVREPAAKEAS